MEETLRIPSDRLSDMAEAYSEKLLAGGCSDFEQMQGGKIMRQLLADRNALQESYDAMTERVMELSSKKEEWRHSVKRLKAIGDYLEKEHMIADHIANTNLCDRCTKDFAACNAYKPVFGRGKGNDNVVYCESYQPKPTRPEHKDSCIECYWYEPFISVCEKHKQPCNRHDECDEFEMYDPNDK